MTGYFATDLVMSSNPHPMRHRVSLQDVEQGFYPLATTPALPGRLGIIRHPDYRQVLLRHLTRM